MATKPKKTDSAPLFEAAGDTGPEVVASVEPPAPAPIGITLPTTADEQLAGQIAMASAEDRLRAEIEAGQKAVAEAAARAATAASE